MAGLASTDLAAMEERLSLRIDNARLELRGEMADLRGEVRAEIGALRGEFGELRAEFGELRGEFGGLRAEVSAQTRWTFLAVFSANAAVAGLVLAALQLAG